MHDITLNTSSGQPIYNMIIANNSNNRWPGDDFLQFVVSFIKLAWLPYIVGIGNSSLVTSMQCAWHWVEIG